MSTPQDTQTFLKNRSAKIKHVLIQTNNYGFYHSPFSKDAGGRQKSGKEKDRKLYDNRFIGRKKARRKIINILENSSTQSGTYLVAGFRGMGKTSLVRMAVEEYNETYGFAAPRRKTQKNPWFSVRKIVASTKAFPYIVLSLAFLITVLTIKFWTFDFIYDDSEWSELYQRFVFQMNWVGILLLGLSLSYIFLFLGIRRWDLYATYRESSGLKTAKNNNELQARYKMFEISLAEDNISEENILKRITLNLLEYWRDLSDGQRKSWHKRPIFRPLLFVSQLFSRSDRRASFGSIEASLETLAQRIVSRISDQSAVSNSPTLSVGGSTLLGRIGLPFKFGGGQRALSYDIATPKEIEEELILILKRIDEFRKEQLEIKVPRFLFIIDELDKIEIPGLNSPTNDKDASNNYDPIYTPDSTLTRRRQQALAILLGNMKNFLNVVRAKFFFIGGRELYEASLADIADRDSFYSSIFNQTIYIESFLKDKSSQRAGITQMTENYLCNLILEPLTRENLRFGEDVSANTLKHVFASLHPKEDGGIYIGDRKLESGPCTYEQTMMKYKIIFLLQNYIIYLTYRSNGTPKKLTSLIEDIVVQSNAITKNGEHYIDADENLIVCRQDFDPKTTHDQFLRFRFDFQYELALTSEIYRPFLIINSRHIKAMGDKLLFSSPFIFDHILKFHSYGFSWRHLEMIPEIILVNREPHLRQYITDLLGFLLKNNIRETVTGLFQYRFYNKVKTELSYLSKISDLSSAAFNFTLDESLQIKKHYRNKLFILQDKYKGYSPSQGDNHFVHSIYFIQLILGDLHFYDQEYDEAIIYYTESIQTLRLPIKERKRITNHQFLLWLKSKLKCGLTLEKMHNYDSSLLHYTSITEALNLHLPKYEEGSLIREENKDMQLYSLPLLATLGILEKSRNDGITYANIVKQEKKMITLLRLNEKEESEENEESDKKIDYEEDNLRRFACLGDFYNNLGGLIYYKNCQFSDLFDSIIANSSPLNRVKSLNGMSIQTSFSTSKAWEEIKDKRQLYKKKKDKEIQASFDSFTYYYRALHILNVPYQNRHNDKLQSALKLKLKGKKLKVSDLFCPIVSTACFLEDDSSKLINAQKFYYFANVLTRLADSILGCIFEPEQNKGTYLIDLKNLEGKGTSSRNKLWKSLVNRLFLIETKKKRASHPSKGDKLAIHPFFSIVTVFSLYRLAAAMYTEAGKQRSAGFQYRKMLFVLKDALLSHNLFFEDAARPSEEERAKINAIKVSDIIEGKIISLDDELEEGEAGYVNQELRKATKAITERIFQYVSWSIDNANRPQLIKYRSIMGISYPNRSTNRPLIYQNINSSSDVKEAVMITEHINLLLNDFPAVHHSCDLSNRFISPYGMVSNRYIRMFELELTAIKYFNALSETSTYHEANLTEKKKDPLHYDVIVAKLVDRELPIPNTLPFGGIVAGYTAWSNNEKQLLYFLIKESMFCLGEIIRSIHIYGLNNFVSFSYLAGAHRRLGRWCQVFRNINAVLLEIKVKDGPTKLEQMLTDIIGKQTLDYLEPNYHYEQAIQYYYKAKSKHKEGTVYREAVKQMFVLEDDYNDNLKHFVTALERYRFNVGTINKQIEELKKETAGTELYKYESYYPVVVES